MKKFALLLSILAVSWMIPQRVCSQTSIILDGSVLTISTIEAGTLTGNTNITGISDKSSVKKIVLTGKFNTADLEAIQSGQGFDAVEEVDMSNAKFMGVSNDNYLVFSTESNRDEYSTEGLTTYDKSVVGSLYVSGYPKEWVNVNDQYNIASETFTSVDFAENERNCHTNYVVGTYIKYLQNYLYYQKRGNLEWQEQYPSTSEEQSQYSTVYSSEEEMNSAKTYSNVGTLANRTIESTTHYYKLVEFSNNFVWILLETTPSPEPGTTIASVPGAYDSPYVINDIVKVENYNYYRLTQNDQLEWQLPSSFTEGESHDLGSRIYATKTELDNTAPASTGLYAVVGNSVEMFRNNEWSTNTEVYNWSQIKFSYWGSTLKTVKLPTQPQNVLASELNGDIWSGCSQLEKVYSGETYADIEKKSDGNNYATIYSTNSTEDERLKAILRMTSFISQDSRFTSMPLLYTGYDTTTKTLTIGTGEAKTLAELVSEYSASGAERIIFSDGSEWTNDNGGTLTINPTSDYNTLKTQLEALGFAVKKVILGKYVTYDIENDVTIVSTAEGSLGTSIADKADMTDAEKNQLSQATKLKMVGTFTSDDLLGLKGQLVAGNSGSIMAPTALDLADANLTTRLPDSWASSVTQVTLPTSFSNVPNGGTNENPIYADNKIPDEFCSGYTLLNTIVIPDGVTIIGKEAFKNCPNLTNVSWSTNGTVTNGNPNSTVTEIQDGAFHNTGLGSKATTATKEEKTFHVPNSIVTIGEKAFRDCPGISYLYFDEGSNLQSIGQEAFWFEGTLDGVSYDGLKEVHVKCNHFIKCHLKAFDEQHTNGHTAVEQAKCRLFYPPISSDYKDYDGVTSRTGVNNSFNDYVGNWKADYYPGGVISTQVHLQDLETIVESGKTVGENTYGPYEDHGWHMFTSTGVTFTSNTEWRTYSEQVPYEVPELTTAEIYLVCGYSHNGNVGAVTLIQMIPGDVVPANTGVLIHYVYKADGNNITFPGIWTIKYRESDQVPYDHETYPDEANWYEKNSKKYPNYLKKINNETIYIPNVVVNEDGSRPYRNFFFTNCSWLANDANQKWRGNDYSSSLVPQEGWAFLRAATDYYSVNNKAYLHLPSDLAGKEAGYGTSPGTYPGDPSDLFNARLLGICIIDENDNSPMKVEEHEISVRNDNSSYYTLQGQKMSSPVSKGIYIHNGRKILVK